MASASYRQPLPGERFAYGGLSCVISAIITNPVDLAKTRMQVYYAQQGAGSVVALAQPPRNGMAATLASITRHEGALGLMRGVTPSMLREASYSTIRYGAYEPIKQMLDGEHPAGGLPADVPLWKKIAAGGAAGALGAAGATPSDLIKVRMQAAMRQADAAVGSQARRLPPTGIWQAASAIYRQEGGLAGLYRGVYPTTVRAAILTASQLPVYDQTKHILLSHPATAGHAKEGPVLHFVCSMVAGLACALTTGPVDLIKTRYMAQQFCSQGKPQRYTGMVDCAMQTVRSGGVLSLWTGFMPAWIRIGPHTCISLLVFEWLRKQAGLAPI